MKTFGVMEILMTILLFAAKAFAFEPSSVKPRFPLPASCVQTLIISRGDNPWFGMTEGYEQEQAAKQLKSVSFDTSIHRPLPSLDHFNHPDALMGRSEERKEVVVNKRYFSDIRRGDATRLGMGQEHSLGEFLDHTFERLKPPELAVFLIQSHIIETYWHLEAKLCLTREEDLRDSYRAFFRGVHSYCTNRCKEEAFSFVVVIGKKDGSMTLVGGDLPDVR